MWKIVLYRVINMDIVITTKKKIDEEYRNKYSDQALKLRQVIFENDRLRREIKRLREMCPIMKDANIEPLGCKGEFGSLEYCKNCNLKPGSDTCGDYMDIRAATYFYKDEYR